VTAVGPRAPEVGVCPECGAPVQAGATCKDNLYALLYLENEIVGGPGADAHFYAVATYGLQHPVSMGYTTQTYDGLRAAVTDMLRASTAIPELRRTVAAAVKDAGRVTRRDDDPVPRPGIEAWPMVATDVVSGGPAEYGVRVEGWARSVIETLDGAAR